MKKITLLFVIGILFNCATEKDACYQDLNNPGINEGANSCENYILYGQASQIFGSPATKFASDLNLIQCVIYIQQEKDCKKKSPIIPKWYIRS